MNNAKIASYEFGRKRRAVRFGAFALPWVEQRKKQNEKEKTEKRKSDRKRKKKNK